MTNAEMAKKIKELEEKLGIRNKMKARILTYGGKLAPGCCDDENGKTVPLTIVPDRDNHNFQSSVVGEAKLSTTADGVDAEITVNDGMLGDTVMKMISDDEAYILDPLILTDGQDVYTKCKIYEVTVMPKEDIINDD